ncbi:MAG: type IV pili methyl-accepting chemotaxis transducer N-terminal domain-containing protein, partial [Gammaproteobacteria bacterium]|nr:type IV pili methyl-accepting chemotaxis transducer N-terminal domain-containing protein [Gammaproteobacteria bacterium]MCP5317777.1 type IV pili methyl-accepting chemotaxis transducer N-terminal domain-containing protein [Chromatiaceae bacterium]MCB1816584.1 type IV pili methyl-accepting chemotaxis transducer N-terminal domain-containing protein [Gammaproteobacteria bacterium]MCP5434751.1 type IV pili methyl-accepting chemotaxis transducer N-terminal domain-containing protein [Chromatiaceae 
MKTTVKKTAAGNRAIPLLTALVLVTIVAAIAVFAYVSRTEGYVEQYLARVSEQQVLSQKVAKYALEASAGDQASFERLRVARDRFIVLLDELKTGAPDVGLPASPEAMHEALRETENRWLALRAYVDEILGNQSAILSVREFVQVINAAIPQLQQASEDIVRILVRNQAEPQQVYVASRQLMLAQRLGDNVSRVLDGGARTAAAIDQFSQDADRFGRVLTGMLTGDNELSIARISNPDAETKLAEAAQLFRSINDHVAEIIETAPAVLPALEATGEVTPASDVLDNATRDLVAAYNSHRSTGAIGPTLVTVLGLLAIALLLLLGLALLRDARSRAQEADQQNLRNQAAIRRLLDEMVDLSDGDLTIEATVTEDITGAIADSVNQAVEEMRTLVTTINETSVRVSASAQETRATALRLEEASDHQRNQIERASGTVQSMSQAMSDMASEANRSAETAQQSVDIAAAGGSTVRRTIAGMDNIREQIQETSKRIKRLGESSQEIGNIVELIEDIADQTNILALNAAMQAAMAGEAGRGFAVVADEVQRLAERSANATKQIDALVKTIQADTNEAVSSMESSTSEVVSGAKLAEDAGAALQRVEQVSQDIAQATQAMASRLHQHSQEVGSINETMNVIQEITSQTSEGTEQTTQSIETLAQMAEQLRQTVARFKLPDEDALAG